MEATEMKKVKLTLVGLDGNAFSIMGSWKSQARKEGWKPEEITAVLDEAMAGDYSHLLATISDHCEGGGAGEDERIIGDLNDEDEDDDLAFEDE